MIEHISLLQGKDEMLNNNYAKNYYYWAAFSYNTQGQFSGICGRFLCSKLALIFHCLVCTHYFVYSPDLL
jgi:hypothetical protein